MASFDSPQFKKTFKSSSANIPGMREFTVGAPTDEQVMVQPQSMPLTGQSMQSGGGLSIEEVEAKIRAAREQKTQELANVQRISSGAKKRLELLADIGRHTRDVKIGDSVFSLRTLKARETKEAALASFSAVDTNLEASYEVRRQQLARSLYQIDGHSFEDVTELTSIEDKLAWFDEQEELVVNKLFAEFNILKDEAQTKYGINTPEQAKEVAEDLKK